MAIENWLTALGLERYVETFARNDVDLDVLRTLNDADLKELGVDSLGARRKILAALAGSANTAPAGVEVPASGLAALMGAGTFIVDAPSPKDRGAQQDRDARIAIAEAGTFIADVSSISPSAASPARSSLVGARSSLATGAAPRIGDVLAGRYNLLDELGRGAMGAVFHAWDVKLKQAFAIKIVLPEFLSQPGTRDLFVREAQRSLRVNHPNLLRVHTLEDDPFDYLVMELADGGSLTERWHQSRRKMTPDDVRQFLGQVLEGLAYLHREGLVHRDIKPDNVLLTKDGRVKLADYGVATSLREQRLKAQVAGTLLYMAPEQLRGAAELDGRADLYSVGIMAHQLLLGRFPFDESKFEEVRSWHLGHDREFEALSVLPWGAVFARAMALEPDGRWESADAMLAALREPDGLRLRRDDETRRAAETRARDEALRAAAERRADEQRRILEAQREDELRRAEEARRTDEERRAEDERNAAEIRRETEEREQALRAKQATLRKAAEAVARAEGISLALAEHVLGPLLETGALVDTLTAYEVPAFSRGFHEKQLIRALRDAVKIAHPISDAVAQGEPPGSTGDAEQRPGTAAALTSSAAREQLSTAQIRAVQLVVAEHVIDEDAAVAIVAGEFADHADAQVLVDALATPAWTRDFSHRQVLRRLTAAIQKTPLADAGKAVSGKRILKVGFGGDYATLEEVLRHAPAGSTIEFMPGEHEVSVTLTADVMIQSSPHGAVVVFSRRGPVFTLAGGNPKIQNLVIEQRTDLPTNDPVSGPSEPELDAATAVLIIGGTPSLLHCRIRSVGSRGLVVRGKGAHPVVTGCRIFECGRAGVLVEDKAQGLFERCEFHDNKLSGLAIRTGGAPVVRESKFYRAQGHMGVAVDSDGMGVFERCESFENKLSGIGVVKGGNPVVRDSKFFESIDGHGIFVADDGMGRFERCEIHSNKKAGIYVRDGGHPTVVDSLFYGARASAGIQVGRNGRGLFERCVSRDNKHDLEVDQSARPKIVDCMITGRTVKLNP
jgi:hypothetical protein